MFNIGGAELLVILLVALLVLGPNKLPQAARQVGHFLGEFRRIADGFQQELKSAMDDPVAMGAKKPKPPAEKPKSPGGPTVIDAEATDREDGANTTSVQAEAAGEPAAAEAGSVPDAGGAPTAMTDAADDDEA